MSKILIGADPEVFISKKNKIISIEGMLGGTKEKPMRLNNWEKGCYVQEDNVLAEYNIPATDDVEMFIKYNQLMLNRIPTVIKANTGEDVMVKVIASHKFKLGELTSEQAMLFGCDPDLNIWTMDYNDAPEADNRFRTAGGHVHMGWEDPEMIEQINIIKFAELFLGVPSVLLDKNTQRKKLYGKSGAMRFKDYGVEYRVLSNFWLQSQHTMKWVFTNAVKAIKIGLKNDFPIELSKRIQSIIDNNDSKGAKKLIVDLKKTKYEIM